MPFLCFMLHYSPKILMAFGETFTEKDGAFHKWLLQNGYPELAALSSAIRGSYEAADWLMKNNFPQFTALDGAIDKQPKAYAWLRKYNFDFLVIFSDAVHERPEAEKWLRENNVTIFLLLAKKIRDFRDNKTFDYHKLHF